MFLESHNINNGNISLLENIRLYTAMEDEVSDGDIHTRFMQMVREYIYRARIPLYLLFFVFMCACGKVSAHPRVVKDSSQTENVIIPSLGNTEVFDSVLVLPSQKEEKIPSLDSLTKVLGSYSKALTSLGNFFRKTINDYERAGNYYQQGYGEAKTPDEETFALNMWGANFKAKGEYEKCLGKFLESLKIYEKNPSLDQTQLLYNIGHIYRVLLNNTESENYYRKGLFEAEKRYDEEDKFNSEKNKADGYNALGQLYLENIQNSDSAYFYFLSASKIYESIDNSLGILLTYNNLGLTLQILEQYNDALVYYKRAVDFEKEMENNLELARTFYNIAQIYQIKKDYKKALEHLNESLDLAQSVDNRILIASIYTIYSSMYEDLGDYKKALEYKTLYEDIEDELFNTDKSKQIADMSVKYETEKKELEIEKQAVQISSQAKDLELKEAESKRNTLIMWGLGIGLTIVGGFSYFFARARNKIRKALELVKQQKEVVEEQKQIVENQKEELEEKNTVITQTSKELQIKNTEITDSINYSKHIQNSMLPPEEDTEQFVENFTLYKPKDIVAGDFYYVKFVGGKLVITAGDCTGHGVPGAFMSVLGMTSLNEILLVAKECPLASTILDELRTKIMGALRQTGKEGESKDGMDMALCILDLETLELDYAGANNPLWILKHNIPEKNDNIEDILIEIKADKMPVGIHSLMEPFKNHTLQLEKGDTFYMFSDGFADQMGGPRGKKFMKKHFKELMVSMKDKPMKEQKEILTYTMQNWLSPEGGQKYEQIDDVLVMGIRV